MSLLWIFHQAVILYYRAGLTELWSFRGLASGIDNISLSDDVVNFYDESVGSYLSIQGSFTYQKSIKFYDFSCLAKC